MDISKLFKKAQSLESLLQIHEKQKKYKELSLLIENPDFWNNQKNATEIQKEKAILEKEVERFLKIKQDINDYLELSKLIDATKRDELSQLVSEFKKLEYKLHQIEIEQMLSGATDKNNAILSINSGQGGIDSQDFAEILLRMYTRYAERHGYSVELMEFLPGEEAGIKNATILITGKFAYGYLKAEIGVHRLVRISPFDSNSRRHTSFCSIWAIPEIEDSIEIEIRPEDLRIDTFKSGGAGGQHVNKTESAIRITHIPTNTVVACQSERSQIKNRSTAMKILRSRLYDLEVKKRLANKNKAEAEKMEASFGSQIRNYVLAPYRLVKDLRTHHETGNVDAVLDGDIHQFIEMYLIYKKRN